MPELWILCMTLDPLKLYPDNPHMKFHFNSISYLQNKKRDGKSMTYRQTDGRTDGQTGDAKVIPKCHLCLQQVTQ